MSSQDKIDEFKTAVKKMGNELKATNEKNPILTKKETSEMTRLFSEAIKQVKTGDKMSEQEQYVFDDLLNPQAIKALLDLLFDKASQLDGDVKEVSLAVQREGYIVTVEQSHASSSHVTKIGQGNDIGELLEKVLGIPQGDNQ